MKQLTITIIITVLIASKAMAIERKYSVDEIDYMRTLVQSMFGPPKGFYGIWTTPGDAVVEDQLRTYMLNGTDPKELEDKLKGSNRSIIHYGNR